MKIAIQRRDHLLIMICVNACVWFLRSNVVLEYVTPKQFLIALGAANVILLCMYVRRYFRLSAAFAVLSKPTELPHLPAALYSGGSEDEDRDNAYNDIQASMEEDDEDEDDEDLDLDEQDEQFDRLVDADEYEAKATGMNDSNGVRRAVTLNRNGEVVLGCTIPRVEKRYV